MRVTVACCQNGYTDARDGDEKDAEEEADNEADGEQPGDGQNTVADSGHDVGEEAATAALEMISLLQQVRGE